MLGEAVVPPNKGASRVYTTQSLLTGDSEFFILGGSICKKNGIVMGLECGERQIVAEVDVADKVEAGRGCDLGEFIFAILRLNVSCDIYTFCECSMNMICVVAAHLYFGMIWGYTITSQSKWHRELLIHIDDYILMFAQ
jgi:hypothetical protein